MKFTSTIYKLVIVFTCALSINVLVAVKSTNSHVKQAELQQDLSQKSPTSTSVSTSKKSSAPTTSFGKRRHVLKKSNWG